MTFGEKLKALRMERGYSQEEFAEILGLSRQAVSKWESDRGTPETDKLLQISNIFGVTLDYLLKEETPGGANRAKGYYVSREMIESFLSYKRRRATEFALGAALIISCDVFGSFPAYAQMLRPFYWGSMALGAAILIWAHLQPKYYREFYTKPLIFDDAVIKSFRLRRDRNRRIYAFMIVVGVVLLVFGSEFLYFAENLLGRQVCNALSWISDALAALLLIVSVSSLRRENLIAHNTDYTGKRGKSV